MDVTIENLMAFLEAYSSDPLVLAVTLAAATLLTEDGALIAGSLLVGSAVAPPLLVIPALAAGILIGDIGLYLLGWTARTNSFLRKRLPVHKSRGLRKWMKGKETPVLFFSRFTPGTRLLTYLSFGFLKLSLPHFILVMSIAAIIWVTGMVLFVSEVQQALSMLGGPLAAIAALITAAAGIILIRKCLSKSRYSANPTGDEIAE